MDHLETSFGKFLIGFSDGLQFIHSGVSSSLASEVLAFNGLRVATRSTLIASLSSLECIPLHPLI